jgi:hypothetical protein
MRNLEVRLYIYKKLRKRERGFASPAGGRYRKQATENGLPKTAKVRLLAGHAAGIAARGLDAPSQPPPRASRL